MKNWIIESNRKFDKLELWKLLILVVFIILTTYADSHWCDGIPIIFGSIGIVFVIWRMLGIGYAQQENRLKKIK